MARKDTQKKKRKRLSPARSKLMIASVVMMALFAALIANLTYFVIFRGEDYAEKALKQWTRSVSIEAERGDIYDRNGNLLASSYTTYQVSANLQKIGKDDLERTANILSALLDLDYDATLAKLQKTDSNGNLKSQVKIKDQVEQEVIVQLSAQQFSSELSYTSDVKRNYPNGTLFAQLLGFTNTDGDGQSGLELTYNSYLSGTDGYQVTETDRDGNTIVGSDEQYVDPVNGAVVTTTTDTTMQAILENALEEACTVNNAKTAQGLLINPKTGEIYAMGSYPTFDPANPPRSDAALLLELAKLRPVTDTYEPGSIFKVVTLASALDSGTVNENSTFSCDGDLTVMGSDIHCWKSSGHGTQTLTQATENSCNCAFMSMALNVGAEAFYRYIYAFGFGTPTSTGLTGETSGSVTHIKYIKDGDLARIGFGQSISCTALQLAMAVSATINGGELLQPYVIDSIVGSDGTVLLEGERTVIRRVISDDTSTLVRSILTSVVDNGSGRNAQVYGYSVGGKTGTSQKYEDDGTVSSTKLIASFVGFAPADNPQYLCLIIVDEPQVPVVYGSTVAAPFVQQVLSDVLTYSGTAPNRDNEAVIVPDCSNMTVEAAVALCKSKGLTCLYMEDELQATVVRQAPAVNTVVVNGSIVILYTPWTTFRAEDEEISYVEMPDIAGMTRMRAFDALQKAGLVMVYDRSQSYGVVTYTQYSAGTQLPEGTTVEVGFTFTPAD